MTGPNCWCGWIFVVLFWVTCCASAAEAQSLADSELSARVVENPEINVGSGFPNDAGQVQIGVVLNSQGTSVGGLQNTIIFDNTVLAIEEAGCAVNPEIHKELFHFITACGASPQPFGCPADAGSTQTIINVMVAAVASPDSLPIPDGVVYTCTFLVIDPLALPTTLRNTRLVAAEPGGHQLCSWLSMSCAGTGGVITTAPTPTATPTSTPSSTATTTTTPTATLPPASTTTATPTTTPTATDTPTPTTTPTDTASPPATPSFTATSSPWPTATATRTAGPLCTGDCNGNHQVTVDEILVMANVALDNLPLSACTAADTNHDLRVTVDEILAAVDNALNGCPAIPANP
jgi:hypothetical protein